MKLSWLKLAWIAAVCVIRTMREGNLKYPNETWKMGNGIYHGRHAEGHAMRYLSGNKSEDDIAHMITRGAMINYLERKQDGKVQKETCYH